MGKEKFLLARALIDKYADAQLHAHCARTARPCPVHRQGMTHPYCTGPTVAASPLLPCG